MKEIFARLTIEAPKFFKRLRAIGIWLMGLSAAFYAAAQGIPDLHIPELISKILSYTTLAGLVISVVSSFPVNDPEALQKKIDEK